MTHPTAGSFAWFEVATDDPDSAQKFYGSLFDWTFDADGPAASGGMDYRNISPSAPAPQPSPACATPRATSSVSSPHRQPDVS
ncbi:hypothetical protein AB0L64_19890 [Kribbella sp. NPDC051936]|uniref:hypothetical protein n=1 Tax=Kribbella sp. NPDC051936 TaxID=3154946 RepID=UPI0034457CA4